MVNDLLKKSWSAFVSKQTNIFSAAFFLMATTIIAQLLGLLKYRLITSAFGASGAVGVFFASFQIPDSLFQVIIAGAISSSFIPLFTAYIGKEKKKEAFEFSSSLLIIGFIIFLIITVLIVLFARQLAAISVPGFSPKEQELVAQLMVIVQLSELFFLIGTIFTAILQSFQHFLIPGIAAAFSNVGIILGILFLAKPFGIQGVVLGALLGSILFCLVQLPILASSGFSFSWRLKIDDAIKKLMVLMVPRSLTIVVAQFAGLADVFFASFISARNVGIYELAQTLVLAPVLLIGQSIAQASFPSLSLKVEDHEEFLNIFMSSFKQILYLTLPISALLIVLRVPTVRLIFGASRFDWAATVDTGLTLALFSLSLSAQSLVYLLARVFYALKDTKTPFFITLFSVIINTIFAYLFIFVNRMPIYFLALAFSIGNTVAAVGMVAWVDRRIHLPKFAMFLSVLKILIAALVMGIALYIPIKLLDQLVFDTTRTINLIILTGIASAAGLVAYVFFTWLLDIQEAYYIIRVAQRIGNWKTMLKRVGEIIEPPKQSI